MERKTRLWLGLGTAVFLGGAATASSGAVPDAGDATPTAFDPPQNQTDYFRVAQASEPAFEGGEGGEGEGGEGGGQILGTITEFRLTSTDPNAFNYDAAPQVAAYAAVVHERYVAAHAGAVALRDAVDALLASPSAETLAAARAAWLDGRAAYAQTEPFLFYAGPIDGEGGPIARIDSWPIDPAIVDYVAGDPAAGLVNDPTIPINRATLAGMNRAGAEDAVTTGWHVIEFLLWGEDVGLEGAGDRPFTDYVAGEGNNDRRREYLRVITQLLALDLSTIVAAWAPDQNNYRAAVLAMDQRNAIGRAFNGMAVLAGYEIALKRISAGLHRSGEEFEQSRFSDNTAAEYRLNLQAIRDVYFGRAAGFEAAGFDVLLAGIAPELNQIVVAALDRAEAAVAAIPEPFDAVLASPEGSPARVAAQEAASALLDLAVALRTAGNRLGVLVVVPGI